MYYYYERDQIVLYSGLIHPDPVFYSEIIIGTQTVQALEKEGAKAISLQPDEPVVFEDESYVMGKRVVHQRS